MTVYGDTFLLFHVHPNSGTRNPSTPRNNARGVNGVATYMGVPNYATNLRYRAWGALKEMTYGNSHPEWGAGGERKLSLSYDHRMRLTGWHAGYVMGWNYSYQQFGEDGGRVTYAESSTDATLSRSYEYDQVGRLQYAHTGSEARMHVTGQPNDGGGYGPYSQHTYYDVWGNVTGRLGWGATIRTTPHIAAKTAASANATFDAFVGVTGGRVVAHSARYKIGEMAPALGGLYGAVSGQLVIDGFKDSLQNHAKVSKPESGWTYSHKIIICSLAGWVTGTTTESDNAHSRFTRLWCKSRCRRLIRISLIIGLCVCVVTVQVVN